MLLCATGTRFDSARSRTCLSFCVFYRRLRGRSIYHCLTASRRFAGVVCRTAVNCFQADESKNWRFRRLLAHQLLDLPSLYSPDDVSAFMAPLAVKLACDAISFVRQPAYKSVSCNPMPVSPTHLPIDCRHYEALLHHRIQGTFRLTGLPNMPICAQ